MVIARKLESLKKESVVFAEKSKKKELVLIAGRKRRKWGDSWIGDL